jgi:hypothetical protein
MPNWTHATITFADERHTAEGAAHLVELADRLGATRDVVDGLHRSEHSTPGTVSLAMAFDPMPPGLRGAAPGADPPWDRWANARWGTKWPDADTTITAVSDDRVTVTCRFAWTVADGLLQQIAQSHPELVVSADWDDEYDGAWYTTTYRAGQDPVRVDRPDLERGARAEQKASYIDDGYIDPHDCTPGHCTEEDCPNGHLSDTLRRALAEQPAPTPPAPPPGMSRDTDPPGLPELNPRAGATQPADTDQPSSPSNGAATNRPAGEADPPPAVVPVSKARAAITQPARSASIAPTGHRAAGTEHRR